VRRFRRLRWPLVALVALVLALIIGYAVRACSDSGSDTGAAPGPVYSHSLEGVAHWTGALSPAFR
jgi:hypothetical protein